MFLTVVFKFAKLHFGQHLFDALKGFLQFLNLTSFKIQSDIKQKPKLNMSKHDPVIERHH